MVLGLTGAVVLAHGAPEKAVAMVAGRPAARSRRHRRQHRAPRMTMGLTELGDGIGFVADCHRACSAWASSRYARTAAGPQPAFVQAQEPVAELGGVRQCIPAMLRGTALGSVLGVLPAAAPRCRRSPPTRWRRKLSRTPSDSAAARSRASPRRRRQQRRRPDELHSAAHARHSGQRHHGADGRRHDDPGHPAGPQVMTAQPQLFWGVIASMWLGNLMLIVLNLPLIGCGCRCCACRTG
jgi:TctA family transporter